VDKLFIEGSKLNNQTFAKPKNKNSTSFSPIFAKKPSDRSFTTESTNAEHDVSTSHSGHNFGNVQVKTSQSFKDSCPLSLLSPSRCPYGGACHTCQPTIQTKLKIGQPNDKYEQEADRVAEQVMRMSNPQSRVSEQATGKAQTAQVQRKCAECEEEEEEQIQRKPLVSKITPLVQRQTEEEEKEEEEEFIQTKPLANQITPIIQRQEEEPFPEEEEEEEILQTKEVPGQTPGVAQDVQKNINNLRGSGKPLPESERSFFEQRFGHDFSQVRVHSGSQSARLTNAVNARAFTVGRDVVFGADQYAPETQEGKKILAHELSHVIQQSTGLVSEVLQRKPDKGRVVVEVVETGGAPVKSAMVFLVPAGKAGSYPGVPVNAKGIAIFEVEEGDYDLIVDPRNKCFAKRWIPHFSVAGNTTQGKVIRLKNICVS
jgi:hypothetical protein